VPQHEANGLQYAHQRENHAYRAAGAYAQGAYKVGIYKVVDVGNEHADDRGYGKLENQTFYRGFSHAFVVLFGLRHIYSLPVCL